MKKDEIKFPAIGRHIENYLYDEEGNIARNKILAVGSMVVLLSLIYSSDVFAGHRSHSSHSSHGSHGSHGSHSSHSSGSHNSHSSGSHNSHSSHYSAPTPTPRPVNSHTSHSSGTNSYTRVTTTPTPTPTPTVAALLTGLQKYPTTSGWDSIFNADYYASHNADVVNAVGNNAEALLKHFQDSGMSEGRQGCAEFNVAYYRANYNDLVQALGDDLKQYYIHYRDAGKAEGRIAYTLTK